MVLLTAPNMSGKSTSWSLLSAALLANCGPHAPANALVAPPDALHAHGGHDVPAEGKASDA